MEALKTVVFTAGALTLASTAYSVLNFVRIHTQRGNVEKYLHAKHRDSAHSDSSSWALVTGATDGIGFALALELASRGFNIVLHSRSESKLARRKSDILSDYPDVKVETVAADAFSADPRAAAQRLADAARGKRVAVVVNNLAKALQPPARVFKTFEGMAAGEVDALVNMNVLFHTHVLHLLLPQLRAAAPALVLAIGSLGGTVGLPYISMYTAAKGYQRILNMALTWEMRAEKSGVDVMVIQCGDTSTPGNPVPEGVMTPGARQVARAALGKVGCGKREVTAYWAHDMQNGVVGFLKRWFGEEALEGMLVGVIKGMFDRGSKTE